VAIKGVGLKGVFGNIVKGIVVVGRGGIARKKKKSIHGHIKKKKNRKSKGGSRDTQS